MAVVFKVLSTLDVNKAIGPDAISPRILKECAAELAPSILQLFNFTLDNGKLSWACFKTSAIVFHYTDLPVNNIYIFWLLYRIQYQEHPRFINN